MVAVNPGTTNLVSYWSLEEASGTRVDAHGSNDLTDNNTVGQGTGVVGNDAEFVKANSEYLSRAHASVSGLGGTNRDFSVSFWVKFNTLAATAGLVSKWNGTGWMFLALSGGTIRFYCYNGTDDVLPTAAGLTTGVWYHVVGYHDATANVAGIVVNDGTPTTGSVTNGCVDASVEFAIGRYVGGGSFLNGEIDEVAFFDQVLSGDEIEWLYNSGAGRSYADLGGGGASTILPFMHHYAKREGGLCVPDKQILGADGRPIRRAA